MTNLYYEYTDKRGRVWHMEYEAGPDSSGYMDVRNLETDASRYLPADLLRPMTESEMIAWAKEGA